MFKFLSSWKTTAGLGILILALSGVIAYQAKNAELLNNTITTLTKEKETAEFQRDSMVGAVGEMTQNMYTLSRENRRLSIENGKSRELIMEWASMNDSAIMNPYMDTEVINTYFDKLFDEFYCTTGGSCD